MRIAKHFQREHLHKRPLLSTNNTDTNAILDKIEHGKNKSDQLYSNSIEKIESISQYIIKLFKIDFFFFEVKIGRNFY